MVRLLTALQDTDSDPDVYGQRPAPSSESLGPPPGSRMGYPESSTPTFNEYTGPAGAREAYPAWSAERQIPLSKEEIEDIFLDLTQKFGFQRDSMRNMVSNVLVSVFANSLCYSPFQRKHDTHRWARHHFAMVVYWTIWQAKALNWFTVAQDQLSSDGLGLHLRSRST